MAGRSVAEQNVIGGSELDALREVEDGLLEVALGEGCVAFGLATRDLSVLSKNNTELSRLIWPPRRLTLRSSAMPEGEAIAI